MPSPLPHLAAVAAAMAAPDQPGATFAALDAALAAAPGHRLFTILAVDEAAGEGQRCYSSRPDAYPLGGRKPLRRGDDDYHARLFVAGEPRFLADRDSIARAFPDHALILALGCESAVNVPVRFEGRTLGALNLLAEAGRYGSADAPLLGVFAALAVPALLRVIEAPPGRGEPPFSHAVR